MPVCKYYGCIFFRWPLTLCMLLIECITLVGWWESFRCLDRWAVLLLLFLLVYFMFFLLCSFTSYDDAFLPWREQFLSRIRRIWTIRETVDLNTHVGISMISGCQICQFSLDIGEELNPSKRLILHIHAHLPTSAWWVKSSCEIGPKILVLLFEARAMLLPEVQFPFWPTITAGVNWGDWLELKLSLEMCSI